MTIAFLILVGFGIGVISGMFGIGGGVLLVPLLVWFFDKEQRQAAGISLAVLSMPIMLPAVWHYYTHEMIHGHDLITAAWLAVGFVIGGVLGVEFLRYLPGPTLRLLFALLLIYVGVRFLLAADNDFAAAVMGFGAVASSWLAFVGLRLVGRRYRTPPSVPEAIRAATPSAPIDGDYYI
jgi:uncharacterized membrane protein YfcA